MKKQKIMRQRKKEDRVVLTDSSGATKSEREEIFNTSRLEMDTHADECSWKQIMNNPKNNYLNKYECESCKGKDKRCSAYYVKEKRC